MVIVLVRHSYNMADTYFISAVQNTELVAGVSLCAPIFMFVMALGNIYGQGGSTLISLLLGKGDTESIRRASSFCFYAAIVTGFVIAAVMLLFRTPILYLLGSDSETIGYASEYYTIIAMFSPITLLTFIHSNLLRCEGMSLQSTIGSVSGTVLNIILDPILISGLHMGAAGAAVATIIGYTLTDLYFLYVVLRKSQYLSIDPMLWRISGSSLKLIMSVGFTAAITNITSSICQVVTNQFLLPYGNDKIAAMGIALKVTNIILLILVGLIYGSLPMLGYFYGSHQKDKLKELLRTVMLFVSAVALLLTVILMIFARPMIGLFLKDSSVITAGTAMLRWQIISMVLVGAITLVTVCFQSAGKAKEALIGSLSRQGVVFLIVILIAGNLLGYTGIILSQAIADVISFVILGILFLKRYLPCVNGDGS